MFFLLEGPRRPLWAIIVVLGAGLFLFQFDPPEKWFGLGIVGVVAFWGTVRAGRAWYYRKLSTKVVKKLCPKCSYDVTDLPGTLCPECGVDGPTYVKELEDSIAKEKVRRSNWARLGGLVVAACAFIAIAKTVKHPAVGVGSFFVVILAYVGWAFGERLRKGA